MDSIPFYQNWTFWAVIIAAAAVVLSQLPPISQWFKKAKLDIEVYSHILISHRVGNPRVQLHLIIRNTGGRRIRIKGIVAEFTRDKKAVGSYPAQTYVPSYDGSQTLLLTPFPLGPKEEWSNQANFLTFLNREDDKKFRKASSDLQSDIKKKREIEKDKEKFAVAEPELVQPFLQMFDQKFVWLPGEYQMHICLQSDSKGADITRNYRFTLFESDSGDLRKHTESYKRGDGIYFDSSVLPTVIVEITEQSTT